MTISTCCRWCCLRTFSCQRRAGNPRRTWCPGASRHTFTQGLSPALYQRRYEEKSPRQLIPRIIRRKKSPTGPVDLKYRNFNVERDFHGYIHFRHRVLLSEPIHTDRPASAEWRRARTPVRHRNRHQFPSIPRKSTGTFLTFEIEGRCRTAAAIVIVALGWPRPEGAKYSPAAAPPARRQPAPSHHWCTKAWRERSGP